MLLTFLFYFIQNRKKVMYCETNWLIIFELIILHLDIIAISVKIDIILSIYCHKHIRATLLMTQALGMGSILWGHNPGPKSMIHSLRTNTTSHAM